MSRNTGVAERSEIWVFVNACVYADVFPNQKRLSAIFNCVKIRISDRFLVKRVGERCNF